MYRPTKNEWLLMVVLGIVVSLFPAGVFLWAHIWSEAHSPEIRAAHYDAAGVDP